MWGKVHLRRLKGRDKYLLVHHEVVSCVRGVRDYLTSAPVTSNIGVEHVKGFC